MKEKLEMLLESAFINLGYDKFFSKVSISGRPELCDFQINSVFTIAKENHLKPEEVGNKLVEEIMKIDGINNYIKNIEFVLPGFINIVVSDLFISSELNSCVSGEYFGVSRIKDDITCVVDYGGPNIAKPLHVGHLRPAIIGESINRILKFKGYKTISDVHLGDIGLQMGQVIYGLKERNLKPEDITIELLQEIYPEMSGRCKENKEVLEKCKEITNDLQNGNEEYQSYFKVMYDVSLNDIKRIYRYLDVDFDYWYGEKDSYKYMDQLMKFLEDAGVVEIDSGAKIIRVAEEGDKKEVPPLILQASNGSYLYATSDLATIYQRMKDFDPNYILYVVDQRQSLHFEQVFRSCKKSGLTKNVILEHNKFGTINGPDGKPFKTRNGEALKLDDLINTVKEIFINKKESNKDMDSSDIDKIVNAIIKFADLQNNRERDYIFDIEKFADVNGKTGPYLLYTAVRIKKIVGDYVSDHIGDKIYNKFDRDLRMKLLDVNEVVTKAADTRMPSYVADYLYDLAVIANTFYQNNNISNLEDLDMKNTWISLLSYTYKVMESLLDLLMIHIPSKM